MQGRGEEGIAQVRQGIASYRATGAALHVPCLCTLLADVSAHLGHTEDGLQALAEAHTLVQQHEERYWEAEIYRLRGVLLLRQTTTPQAEAETWLQRALDVARRQQAKLLELRAAMSLARLWQQLGKCGEARELLAPVYNWFTEGFDTADLQEAKGLLEEISSSSRRVSISPPEQPPPEQLQPCRLPRPQPPVLSVRCGASRRPAGGIQRWPAAGAGRAGRPQARASAGRVAAGWHGVGGRSRWKRPFDFPIPFGRLRVGSVVFGPRLSS